MAYKIGQVLIEKRENMREVEKLIKGINRITQRIDKREHQRTILNKSNRLIDRIER